MLASMFRSKSFSTIKEYLNNLISPLLNAMWPLYTSGIIVGSMCFVASVYEKCFLANLTSAANATFLQDQPENEIKQAAELMESIATREVKNYIAKLSPDEFDHLRNSRENMTI